MSIYALDEHYVPSLADVLVVHDADAPIDEELRRRGTPHLEAVLARSTGTFEELELTPAAAVAVADVERELQG